MSLNHLNTNRLADDVGFGSTISNSTIFGSTAASTCDASLACHAMVAGDVRGVGCNSVLGSDWRRVGVLSSQYVGRYWRGDRGVLFFCTVHPPRCVTSD